MTERRTVTVDGVPLGYEVSGPTDGDPLLLLHALGASAADWAPYGTPSPGRPDTAVALRTVLAAGLPNPRERPEAWDEAVLAARDAAPE